MSERGLGRTLIKYNIIEPTQLSLLNYGVTVAKLLFANLLSAIIISIFLDTTFYCILFLGAFAPLRRYSGGFHAGSPIVCFLESQILVLFAQIFATNFTKINPAYEIILFLSLLCCIIIFIKSPIYSRYKPLNPKEIIAYRRLARYLSIIYFVFGVIFYLTAHNELFLLIFTAVFFQTILLFIPEREHKKKD